MASVADRGLDAVEALAPAALNVVEGFRQTALRCADTPALRAAADAPWMSWRQWVQDADRVSQALLGLGVGRGDPVAMMLRNCPEFHVIDMGALQIGAIPFSLYNTSSPNQIAGLLRDSGARIVIAEEAFAPQVRAAGAEDVRLFVIGESSPGPDAWEHVIAQVEPGSGDLESHRAAIEPDDVATIIYTSGTTGPPKGVQLTHANLVWMARVLPVWWELTGREQSFLSYLPMAHIAERIFTHYLPMIWGWPVTCCADPRAVGAALPQVRPTLFFAPPRFWEKIRGAALAGPLAAPGRGELVEQAIELERSGVSAEEARDVHDGFADVRAMFGLDRLNCAMISAASVPAALVEFWRGLGIPLVEGYGLSEASAGVCFDDPSRPRIGTVGYPLPGVEVDLAEDGELLVRSPSVMIGYRGAPDQTAEAIDADGWLRTGDIARIDDDGRVRIVDRKKEIIINAAGKNMSPTAIEGELKSASPLIGQAVCVGDARPYNVALIVLDADVAGAPASQAAADEEILRRVEEAVAAANARLSRVEQIKRYEILPVDWLPDSDELTPTMKLKRRVIETKYAELIDGLYGSP